MYTISRAFMILFIGTPLLLPAQVARPATIHALFEEDQRDQQIDNNSLTAPEQQKLRARYDQRDTEVKQLMQTRSIHNPQDLFDAGVILTHSHVPENQLLAHLAFTAAAFGGIVEAKHLAATSLDRYLILSDQTQLFGTSFQIPYRGWHHDVSSAMSDSIRAAFCVPAGKQLDKLFELNSHGVTPTDTGHDQYWDKTIAGCH